MNISKAITKQNKSLKRFLFFYCFAFFVVFLILISVKHFHMFTKTVLIFLELFIIVLIINKLEKKWLRYAINKDKILIKNGLIGSTIVVRKRKVTLVHTQGKNKDLSIIIVIASKSKKRNFKLVDRKFLLKNRELYQILLDFDNKQTWEKYFYTTIYDGGFSKYKLLNDIYINCENALFTDNVIDNIKTYRNIE